MKTQRGALPGDGRQTTPAPSATWPSTRSLPAIAHGIAHEVGSLEVGKLADLVIWKPAFFGVKPELVAQGRPDRGGRHGDPSASIPTPQPVRYRRCSPPTGGGGVDLADLPLRRATEDGVAARLGLRKATATVRGCRGLTKAAMVNNSYCPRIEVDAETYEVRADGQVLTCEPARVLPRRNGTSCSSAMRVITEAPITVDPAALVSGPGHAQPDLGERRWTRKKTVTTGGREIALASPTGTVLEPGDVLAVEEDWYLVVEARPEPVLALFPESYEAAVRIAFDVGNRHTPWARRDTLLVPDDTAIGGTGEAARRPLGAARGGLCADHRADLVAPWIRPMTDPRLVSLLHSRTAPFPRRLRALVRSRALLPGRDREGPGRARAFPADPARGRGRPLRCHRRRGGAAGARPRGPRGLPPFGRGARGHEGREGVPRGQPADGRQTLRVARRSSGSRAWPRTSTRSTRTAPPATTRWPSAWPRRARLGGGSRRDRVPLLDHRAAGGRCPPAPAMGQLEGQAVLWSLIP